MEAARLTAVPRPVNRALYDSYYAGAAVGPFPWWAPVLDMAADWSTQPWMLVAEPDGSPWGEDDWNTRPSWLWELRRGAWKRQKGRAQEQRYKHGG